MAVYMGGGPVADVCGRRDIRVRAIRAGADGCGLTVALADASAPRARDLKRRCWRQRSEPIRSSSAGLMTFRWPSDSSSRRRSRNRPSTRLTCTGVRPTASAMCCWRSGNGIALFADHVARGNSRHQMQKQMGDAFLGRALAERGQKFGHFVRVGDAGFRDGPLNVGIGNAPPADFGTRKSAHLNLGQCLDREVKCLFEDGDGGKQISRQQEFQDLPASVGKLEIAKRPARTKHEYILRGLIADGDLRARAGCKEVLPAGFAFCFCVFGSRPEQRSAKAVFAVKAGYAN